jgi:hypothetical protein
MSQYSPDNYPSTPQYSLAYSSSTSLYSPDTSPLSFQYSPHYSVSERTWSLLIPSRDSPSISLTIRTGLTELQTVFDLSEVFKDISKEEFTTVWTAVQIGSQVLCCRQWSVQSCVHDCRSAHRVRQVSQSSHTCTSRQT